MAHDGKIAAVSTFVRGVEQIKLAAKDDAKKALASLPVEILSDPDALEAWMAELLAAVIEKHVLADGRKIRPGAAKLIKAYVRGMTE